MNNLLEQTKNILECNGKTLQDIEWIGCKSFTISFDDFLRMADVEVDEDSYIEQVFLDLLICGDNWWLERQTYDGTEWWEYKTIPTKPNENRSDIKSLLISGTNEYLRNIE